MRIRGVRIDKETGKLSTKDNYAIPKIDLEELADYAPSPSKDQRELWEEDAKEHKQ